MKLRRRRGSKEENIEAGNSSESTDRVLSLFCFFLSPHSLPFIWRPFFFNSFISHFLCLFFFLSPDRLSLSCYDYLTKLSIEENDNNQDDRNPYGFCRPTAVDHSMFAFRASFRANRCHILVVSFPLLVHSLFF